MEVARVGSAPDLDKHRLVQDLIPARRFQSIADDGFDPASITITRTLSLLDHVCRKKRYSHLRADYDHTLWRTLQDRHWSESQRDKLMEKALRRLGLTVIEAGDARRAKELGLYWREHFVVEVDNAGYEYTPVLLPLDGAIQAANWATLDGIQVLTLLYRQSLDVGNTQFASGLRRPLEDACRVFGNLWQGEAADTWRYVMNTLMLAWMPDYEPGSDAVNKARAQLSEEFENSQPHGRGRRKLSPDQVTQGKVERRWRRRALMRAGVLDERGRQHYIGLQTSTPFNAWLAANRQAIDAHLTRAYLRLALGDEADTVDQALMNLGPMQVPTDDDHPIIPPPADPYDEYRFGGTCFDLLPIEPVRIPGSGSKE